jgi:hypothetical protein
VANRETDLKFNLPPALSKPIDYAWLLARGAALAIGIILNLPWLIAVGCVLVFYGIGAVVAGRSWVTLNDQGVVISGGSSARAKWPEILEATVVDRSTLNRSPSQRLYNRLVPSERILLKLHLGRRHWLRTACPPFLMPMSSMWLALPSGGINSCVAYLRGKGVGVTW